MSAITANTGRRAAGASAFGLALTAVLLLGSGCGDGQPANEARAAPAPVSDGTVEMKVTAVETSVPLGGTIVFRVALSNTGGAAVDVNVPRLDRNSLTFEVRRPGGEKAKIERIYGEIVSLDEIRPDPPFAKSLEPGETLEQKIGVAAVEVGKHVFVPHYRRVGVEPLVGSPVAVEVTPQGSEKKLGARITTSQGAIVVRLRPDVAFNTVESFASLASKGFFDGLTFHRIVKQFMAQGGDPKGDGSGGPGYYLPREMHKDLLHDRGVMSMARTGHPDTSGSQFFLMFAKRPDLDNGFRGGDGYITFAEMVEGEATLAKLEATPVEIPPAIQAQIAARGYTDEQVQRAVRAGQIEVSWPKERVEIRAIELITLK